MNNHEHNYSVIRRIIYCADVEIGYQEREYVISELANHFQDRHVDLYYDLVNRNKGWKEHQKEIANALMQLVLDEEEWVKIREDSSEDVYIINRAMRQRLVDEVLLKIAKALGESHEFYEEADGFIRYRISQHSTLDDEDLAVIFVELNESIKHLVLDKEVKSKLVLSIFKTTAKLGTSARPQASVWVGGQDFRNSLY